MTLRSRSFMLGLFFVALSGACATDNSVQLFVSSDGLDDLTNASLEVRVFPGPCPDTRSFILSDPSAPLGPNEYRDRGPATGEFAPVGELNDQNYAFLAVIRDASCQPIRYGCLETNPAQSSTVTIATEDPRGVGLSPYCHASATCSGALCVSGAVPVECADGLDGSSCESTDGARGVCCGGSCLPEGAEDRCPSPPPPCDGGTCTAPPPESITITVTGEITSPDGTVPDRLQAALAWRIVEAADTEFGASAETVAVTDAVDLSVPGAGAAIEATLLVPSEPPPALEASSSFGLTAIAVAALVVAAPTASEDELGVPDVHRLVGDLELPSPYGVSSDTVVIYSEYPVAPEFSSEGGFPDGIAAGVHIYVFDRADGTYRPSANPPTEVPLCAFDAGSAQQRDCVWGATGTTL